MRALIVVLIGCGSSTAPSEPTAAPTSPAPSTTLAPVARRSPRTGEPELTFPGRMHSLDYQWGSTSAWLGQQEAESPAANRTCPDAWPPLSVEVLKALDECLDVAPTPDFIVKVASVDGALVITPRDRCAPAESYLCDADSAYFQCAAKVGRVVPKSASSCWYQLTFATMAR